MLAVAAICFSLFFPVVLGFPLDQRDVIAPHITDPHKGTIWTVGAKELVTWETDNLPPDSQITNPIGRVILGLQANGSLNLDLDHPLATNFKLRAGNVTITVPDVPPRDDYIIVLMGDSGNASPAFAITSIQGGSGSYSGSASGTPTPSSSLSANSPPITGNSITGGTISSTRTGTTRSVSTPVSTPTTPIPLPFSEPVSMPSLVSPPFTTSELTTSALSPAAATTSTSSAWSVHSHKLWSVIAAPLALALLI